MIQYIIWDAGGTLFDTYPAKARAIQQALAALGGEAAYEEVLRLTRVTTRHALETLAQRYDVDLGTLQAGYQVRYRAVPPEAQPPFPGVREICRYICTIGDNFVVTHRAASSLNRLLRAHEMDMYFADSLTKESPFPRKPDPASTEAILATHRLDRARTLAVGDRKIDVLAAKRASIRVCFYGEAQDDIPADIFVTDYRRLLEQIKRENVLVKRREA
ncbi:MAG: HAD hydrolase-like protein [Anaerolineae bacterium]